MISAALAVLESEEQRNELSEIYENNISNFYNIAFQQLHNKHDAEDAIQDAFLAIANNTSIFSVFRTRIRCRTSTLLFGTYLANCGTRNTQRRNVKLSLTNNSLKIVSLLMNG